MRLSFQVTLASDSASELREIVSVDSEDIIKMERRFVNGGMEQATIYLQDRVLETEESISEIFFAYLCENGDVS